MLSPCSHDGGSPVIWKIWMSCCWTHQQHFVSPMIHAEHQPSVENFISNAFVLHSWSLCLDGRSDFLEFMCIWCKLPPWVRERLILFPLVPSQVSYASAKVFYGLVDSLPPFHMYSLAHQATDWFAQGKGVCCANSRSCTRVRYPRWWFPTKTR